MPQPVREIEVEVMPKASSARRIPGRAGDPLMELVARLMDTLFVIPGTSIRFGLDPIIGLIPGIGSPLSAFVSLVMIARSAQQGVPNVVLARMAMNVLINAVLDGIPVVGDAASVFYRSNQKNYELLQKHAGTRKKATLKDWLFVLGLMLGVTLFVVIMIVGLVTVVGKFFGWLTSGK